MARALIVLAYTSDREKASRWVASAPWGTRIEFKAPKRTLPQNDRFWAMLTDVAAHMRKQGKDYTTDQWKAIFMHACGKEVSFLPSLDGKTFIPWGQSSSDLSKDEMTDLIDFIAAWAAENGVHLNEPNSPDHPANAPSGDSPTPSGGPAAGAIEAGHPASAAPAGSYREVSEGR